MKAIYAVPATLALVYRAHSHKSLTPAGIVAAALSAAAHAVHPWNLPFVLLVVFFLAGTRVTKVKKDAKASMTVHSQGSSGGEGPRTHVQVFANSLVASVLSLAHAYQLHQRSALFSGVTSTPISPPSLCLGHPPDILPLGIIANYAVMAADTFSSELGILSTSTPRLITSPTLRRVPRGTNGGVTALGLGAGLLGSLILVSAAALATPVCPGSWTTQKKAVAFFALTLWGALGSVFDSVIGALFQRSVRDVRSGRIVEGEGGSRVLVAGPGVQGGAVQQQQPQHVKARAGVKAAVLNGEGRDAVEMMAPRAAGAKQRKASSGDGRSSRVVESGWDLLDNNDVNFLTAFTMSMGAMAIAGWYWGVRFEDVLRP